MVLRTARNASHRLVVALLFAAIAALMAACSSNGASSQQGDVRSSPTPIPTNTPVPAVPKEVGACDLGPKAQCPGADFRGVDLGEVEKILMGTEGRDAADLTGANLREADFTGAKLKSVDFTGAGLEGAIFRDADLEGAAFFQADLRNADFTGANLKNADLEEAQLDGAVFCNATMPDGTRNTKGC